MTMTDSKLNQIRPLSYNVDQEGKISIAGIEIEELAQKFRTPLYVLCEETIRQRARAYKQSFEKLYPNHLVIYASKALNCKAICKLMDQEGLGIDVVSAGELYTALSVNFPSEKIIFHGNNKSEEEIAMAIENKVTIVLDNYHDLKLIQNFLSKSPNSKVALLIRITPGIECHTHEYIKTGKIDSKFGFNLNEIDDVITKLQAFQANITIKGLHVHIGSQIFETVPHRDACKVLLELYKQIKEKYGIEFSDLNIGGGLGIKYTETDDPPEIEDWVRMIVDSVKDNCKALELKEPRILTEPGRSLVGPAGATVYRVGNIKDIPGLRKYIAVDGGMADNTRPIMYGARYIAEIDGKLNTPKELVTVAGKYCESGDVLIRDIELPRAESGDLLITYSTGAYNYSMASNYNRATKAATVLVNDGEAHLIIERETLEDLVKLDRVPKHLG